MASSRVVFRIIYGTLYFVLCFVLLGLLIISPGDAIYQAKLIGQSYNIWIIIIAYASTIALVLFIYALRLYITKTVLASIPKAWIPVDRGDVPKHVYKIIWAGLGRSAAIAYEARPRLEPVPVPLSVSPPGAAVVHGRKTPEGNDEKSQQHPRRGLQRLRLTKTATSQEEQHSIVVMPPEKPVWGDIEHYGWASPTSPDLPNLQYGTILAELPNLIEAKAVGLAPPEPPSPPPSPHEQQPPLLDPEAVALLQRAPSMDLREYLAHLAELGVLAPGNAAASGFLGLYEHARYSTRPISNARFREMMHLFAELLRSMQPLDPVVLERLQVYDEEEDENEEEEIDDDDGEASKPSADIDDDAPRSHMSRSRSPASSARASPKQRPSMSARNSSANTWAYRTAPTTPRTGGRVASVAAAGRSETSSPASSVDSFAQTRRPYPVSRASSASLQSGGTGTGTASGSVIRLARDEEDGDMPYVLTLTDTI